MQSIKRRRPTTQALLNTLFRCFWIAVATAVFCVQESSRTIPAPDARDGEARQALDRAEVLRADWTAAAFRQAIDLYDEAARLWTSISDLANASHANLKSGDVYFLISEYKQALQRYRNAEALGEKSNDSLAQATALSQIGRLQSYLGNNDLAQKQLTKALHLFEQHEADRTATATNAYGEALSNLGEVSYAKGDFANASKQLDSAPPILRRVA